jgi:outer membrane protein TolC
MAMAAARVREAKAMAGVVESAESLQINGEATLKRHNWPKISSTARRAVGCQHLGQQRRHGLQLRPGPVGPRKQCHRAAVDQAHMSVAEARQAQLELQNNVVRAYIQLSLHYAQRDIVKAELAQQEQILAWPSAAWTAASAPISKSARPKRRCRKPIASSTAWTKKSP